MADPVRDFGLLAIKKARTLTIGILDGVPTDQMTHQPFEGANHALWIMGHLGTVDEFYLKEAGGRPVTRFDEWRKTFFFRSKPSSKLADYPPIAEVRDYFHNARAALLQWFGSMDDAAFFSPLPGRLATFEPHFGSLLARLCWHEGMHSGQLTVIRKSIGQSPVFG